MSTPQPHAIVTGASAGIGAAFAERLAALGYSLTLVARRRERLETLAQRLHARDSTRVDVLAADLTRHDDLHAVEARRSDTPPDMLVNNAGFGGYMPFADLPPERAEALIRLQVVAPTRLTRAALPGMLARGRGDIINVASRLAFSGTLSAPQLPKRTVYAATKAYIVTFSQLLAAEVAGSGVRVQVLCPGVVRTEFHAVMGADPSRMPPEIVMSPEDVVQASLKGLELGELICVPGLDDPAMADRIGAAQRELLQHSGSGTLADRYQEMK